MKTQRFLGAISLFIVAIMTLSLSTCSDDKDEPEVEPLPKAFFEIERYEFKVSAEAQTIDIRIHTNIKASTSILDNTVTWASIGNLQQTDEYLIYQINVKENTDSNERIGYIIFNPVLVPGFRIADDSFKGGNTIIIIQASTEP